MAPAVTLQAAARVVIFPNATSKHVSVRITAHRAAATGTVRLNLPPGWTSEPDRREFKIALIMGGHGHDCAGAVFRQDIVGDP